MSDLQTNQRHAIAVHEAGHAVVATALEVLVLSVTIVRAGRRGGHTDYQPINLPETEGIIATGGYASEERWKVRESPQVHEKLRLNWPGFSPIATRSDHYKLLRYAQALGKSPGGDVQLWINGRLIKADDILIRHWAAVEDLVKSLLAEGTLSGEQVTHMWELHSAKQPRTTTETDRAVENSDKD